MAQKFTVPITVKQLTSASSDAITVLVDADTQARLKIEAGGRLTWGSGALTGDTNLYRSAADTLSSDDTLKVPVLFVDNIEVDTTGATTNQVLKFNGTKFIPGTASTVGSIDDLSDVDTTTAAPTTNQYLKWNGTNWVPSTVAAGGATNSTTAPASPTAGALWFKTDTAQTFIYYVDGTSNQWVEIGASGMAAIVSDTAPSSPIAGQIWFNSLNGGTYVYYSSAWTEVGAVPINALLNTINAKGDLLAGTADNTIGRLGVGTNGYFLKADSAQTTGLVWAAIPSVSILDDVGDVTITSAASGQVLQWNGSGWVNATVSTDIMTDSKNAALLVMDIGS